ncbi:spindle and kinetochore-associated protein 2 [Anolis sagrei]|uniref:spindle and kinetochore-associated protein 2 n=1 Tax=Anolis sagrei TaxID=38937 RepID=UPI0035227731
MEATVSKLETLFLNAESDLNYIQAKLEFEVSKGLPDGLSQEENPLVLIQQLSLVKSRYKTVCDRLQKISIEKQESMRSMRATLAKTMKLVQEIQHHASMETSPLSEEEQLAVQHLKLHTGEVTEVPAKQDCPNEHEAH